MTKSFKALRSKMSSKAQILSKEKTDNLLKDMALQELRQARHMSQEKIAHALSTKQANVSRLEQRTDMYISTLRGYIEAMGGQLDIIARFPEGEVHITQFKEIDPKHKNI